MNSPWWMTVERDRASLSNAVAMLLFSMYHAQDDDKTLIEALQRSNDTLVKRINELTTQLDRNTDRAMVVVNAGKQLACRMAADPDWVEVQRVPMRIFIDSLYEYTGEQYNA